MVEQVFLIEKAGGQEVGTHQSQDDLKRFARGEGLLGFARNAVMAPIRDDLFVAE
jgi:hypothetical protein